MIGKVQFTTKLTPAQRRMVDVLAGVGPFDLDQMKSRFGRNWRYTWKILDSWGFVDYVIEGVGDKNFHARESRRP